MFKPSDQFEILFERLVNTDRLVLNAEVLKRTVKVYPPFHITRTVPENGAANVPVTELKICSTTPIVPAELETFQNIVKSNVPVGLWRWNDPYRIFPGNPHSPCAVGEFENMLRYGLIPKTEYRIELSLTDDFGQTVSIQLAFTSGDVPAYSRTITSMQKGYTVTSPERTTFTYAVENLEYVDVTLCQVTAEQFLRYTLQRPSVLEPPSGFSCSKKQSRRIDLPKRYWARNYIQLKISDFLKDSRGQFILTVTNPLYRTPNLVQFYNHTLISVTRLAVQEKKVEWQAEYPESQGPYPEHLKKALGAKPQNLYWVTESGTLKNISGAVIQLFQKKIFGDSPQLIKSIQGKTDTQGVALLEAIPDLYGAVVTQGDDTAVVVADMDRLQWASPAQSSERAYLYTDRPIYRPGHEVFLKGIHRVGVDGAYEIFREKKADVKVYSSKDEVVFQQSLDVSENGTFHTTFTLPPDASLGTYRIEALSGIGFFDVEEYVPAAFKVETRTDHKEYIAGESAQLTLDANYYFGVPVEGGEVEYSLVAQDYYFDRYTDEYFQFGSGWYWSFNEGYGDQYLLRGRAVLSSQGKADIVQNLDFNAFFKDKELERSKIFTLFAAIKNLNGQAVSTQKSFIVHRGEFYLGLNLEKTFLGKGALVHARIKSVDVQGKPRGVSDVSAKIYKIRWEAARRKEVDGGYYYRSERKTDLVEERMLDTDKNGNAQFDFLAGQEGEFELVLETKDSRKNLIKTTQEFYVSGPGDVEVRQTNNETLELATDKGEVHVGTRVKVIIKSPYAQAKALVALERGTIFQYEILDIDQNLYEYTFEVKKEHIPNIYFTAFLLSPEPEIKYGQINYQVNTKEVSLDIAVTSNKKTYLPGEDITLDFRITDGSGKPVQTELSAAVVDMSVLALKGNPKKNPLVFFYDGQPLAVMTSSNIKNILHEAEIPTGTKGGGGVEPEDLARKKRGVFKDTAYWHGVITTDREGRARVTFPLPDNLTTWQVESVGVTRDTKLGAGYQEFMSRKDLMVIPLQPRFVVPGDEFLIGAKVFNETKKTQKLAVSLDPRALELLDKAETSVSVKPREAETVYFSVRAPETQVEGTHPFAVSAKNKEYEDTVEQSIPITRNDTYEATATANYSKNPEEREYIFIPENVIKNKGGVTVNTSATLAVFLSDALKYLFQYPYGCSEQIASKLSAIAIVKRGLNLPNMAEQFSLPMVEFQGREYTVDEVVTKGLAQIMQNQRSVGGFAYYPEMPDADFYLTLHVVNTLIDLKAAGYSVDSQMLERATEYLNREIFDIQKYGDSKDLRILTAYTVSRVDRKQVDPGLASWVESYRDDKKFIREDISSTSLSHLALYLAYMNSSKKLKNEVYQILGNRIDIDGRGAHMRSGNQFLWSFYETPVQNTALLLKAFAIDQRDTAVLDKVVRWLLKSRAKDGAWGSTHNTLSVIDAFTEYLAWKQETESEFRLSLVLNEQVRDTFEFNKDTILKTFTYAFPISDFREQTLESLRFLKVNKNNLPNFYYYDAHLKYYFPIDQIPARDEGFTVSRAFYAIDDKEMRKPLSEAKQGEVVKGRLTIIVPEARNFVSVEDFIPAGGEIVNFKLATEAATVQAFGDNQNQSSEDFWRGYYDTREDNEPVHQKLYPDAVESHDDRLFLFKQSLNPGVYEYDYYFRALIPGKFHHLPAVVSEMYFPETFGRTRGEYFEVRK